MARRGKSADPQPTPQDAAEHGAKDHGAQDHDHHAHDHGKKEGTAHEHGPGAEHDDRCPECVVGEPGHGHGRHDHAAWDHFPSDLELVEAGVIEPGPTETELARLMTTRRFAPSPEGFPMPGPAPADRPEKLRVEALHDLVLREQLFRPLPGWREDLLRPILSRGLLNLIGSYRRVRRNEATLDRAERDRFNTALAAMDGNPAWQTLMAYHAGGTYRMHSIHGAVGRQRFLPWHRRYLFAAEQMLRTVDPTITIPYWDYVAGSSRPDWVHLPSGVSRPTPGPPGFLPSASTIVTILARGDYSAFTTDLESNAHNQVHNWSKGTLQNPSTASYDPIFWMLHGNVDRLWAVWQETHTDPVLHVPSLTGVERVMDPWSSTVADLDDTAWDLGYRYG